MSDLDDAESAVMYASSTGRMAFSAARAARNVARAAPEYAGLLEPLIDQLYAAADIARDVERGFAVVHGDIRNTAPSPG